MSVVQDVGPRLGVAPTCKAMGVARATYYRSLRPKRAPSLRRSPRALSVGEEKAVLKALHEPRFADLAPAQVYATLLDEDRYLCSERTMYRVLARNQEVRERRNQLRHPKYATPELLATGPNELWSWDITKLRGPVKWSYSYLYVILDVYSRYVVGWMVAPRESAALAKSLIRETCKRQGIARDQLTIHADRGSSMKSKLVAHLLSDLGVTKTHSRPHVSNDNPYSESHFKTLKYRPEFPQRFGCIEDARSHCVDFFRWYNTEHRHSGIGLMTPADVHYGLATEKTRRRAAVLEQAYATHPERFPRGISKPPVLSREVWINKPRIEQPESILEETANSEAQNRRLTTAMESGIHRGTPEIEAKELIEVGQ